MEENLIRLNAAETFAACEQLWAAPDARETIRDLFAREYADFTRRVMVLDDDPTGVQTVHDIDVVTSWEEAVLAEEIAAGEKLFFILTNSRSFSAETTAAVHQEIARSAMAAAGESLMLISRGDSTLRGHYPLETRVLRETLEACGHPAFHGEILCPFFREGGRFTLDSVHYVKEGEELVPAAQTEFARDKTFGYSRSFLPEYIAEKSAGAVSASDVLTVTLKELRNLNFTALEKRLLEAPGFRYVAVDAMEEADVQAMAIVLMRLMRRGRHYLIRSAAAVPKVFGAVPDRALLSREEMIAPDSTVGGLVLVGSHVQKTTRQLECLRQSDKPLCWIEFHVDAWQQEGGLEAETRRAVHLAEEAMHAGQTAVVYTSRRLLTPEGASAEELLAISVKISEAVTAVVSSLSFRPRFLIAKGGITSSDVGVKALQVRRARVLGQAQPGIPVWETGPESRFPGLSYIIFPGNVGGEDTLRTIVEQLA